MNTTDIASDHPCDVIVVTIYPGCQYHIATRVAILRIWHSKTIPYPRHTNRPDTENNSLSAVALKTQAAQVEMSFRFPAHNNTGLLHDAKYAVTEARL